MPNRRSRCPCCTSCSRELENLLQKLPQEGWLFPTIRQRDETYRGSRFYKLCRRLKLKGITLHSYRYAWAERAKVAGMPLREAMAHLGHQSRAIHQAYSEQAEVVTLPLEYYEEKQRRKIVQFQQVHREKKRGTHLAIHVERLKPAEALGWEPRWLPQLK